MNLFVFGLGYTAATFARVASPRGSPPSPARSRPSRKSGAAAGVTASTLLSSTAIARRDARIAERLAEARCAPGLDPAGRGAATRCSRAFREAIAAAPRLAWIGYLSTIGVYGDHGGGWIDETTPCQAAQRRARASGSRARRPGSPSARATGKPVADLPPRRHLRSRAATRSCNLRAGTARRIVKPGQVFNRIHVDDIAGVLMASLERPRAGAIYNVADDEPAPPQDVVAYAAELAGIAPPPEIPFDKASLSPMAASFYGENKRVSNRLIRGRARRRACATRPIARGCARSRLRRSERAAGGA